MWVELFQRNSSRHRMDAASLCFFISASLTVQPDRAQFFRYESFNLSCEVSGSSGGWTVRRNTSTGSRVRCDGGWGQPAGSSCFNPSVYTADSGTYWCESESGGCSNVLNIAVNVGVVILKSPALPVTAGDRVTLQCSYKERYAEDATSAFNATFYKNNIFIGNRPEGTMVLEKVSESDEGFYKCQHPTKGESLQSFLSVEVGPQPTTEPPPLLSVTRVLCWVLLFILYTSIFIVCVYTYRRWTGARADAKHTTS